MNEHKLTIELDADAAKLISWAIDKTMEDPWCRLTKEDHDKASKVSGAFYKFYLDHKEKDNED